MWAVLQDHLRSVINGAENPIHNQIKGGVLMPRLIAMVIRPKVRIGTKWQSFHKPKVRTVALGGTLAIGGYADIVASVNLLCSIVSWD